MITRCILRLLIILAIAMPQTASGAGQPPRSLGEALGALDKALDKMPAAIDARHRRIDSLRLQLATDPDRRRHLLCELGAEYGPVNVDSAISAYRSAIYDYSSNIYDTIPLTPAVIEYARRLSAGGYIAEAFLVLDSLAPSRMSMRERQTMYDVKSRLCINAERVTPVAERRRQMHLLARGCLDSLYGYLSDRPVPRKLIKAKRLTLDGDTLSAAGELLEALQELEPGSDVHGQAAAMLAELYARRPERREEYLYYLALAATAEAINGHGDAFSLQTLGSEMYEEGDFDRALAYMAQAGETLESSGHQPIHRRSRSPLAVMLRTMQLHEMRKDAITLTALILLLLLVVALGAILYRRRHDLREAELARAHTESVCQAKDVYIAQLLGLCSGYIDAMQDFNRLVGRKIKANQTKDLYATVESGKALRQMNEQFYETFDKAILKIYPDFIAAVGRLLRPDQQIECPSPDRLNPELRIAAFIRIGVSESPAIAKFLGLSLNTVYTYRNRLRSRAIERESFERDVLKIGQNS
ncbi:MAG: DUF6377 domain-containing protein [Bacteroides sp.]|nr:DUF6377 domain-containing protein [Bacteroides sp.]MCM1095844.1 DUF6377 domain-containing protein [Terasakiella sp.]